MARGGGAGVSVSRATAVYGVHAYHTKVPVEAISPFIHENTAHAGSVLDPFCGSGMTGIAAALAGRRAFLNDLSPAAVHIARNYTTPCSAPLLRSAAASLLAWAEPQIVPSYTVSCPICPGDAITEYVVWSDTRRCPNCLASTTVWEQRQTGLRTLKCPSCGQSEAKVKWSIAGEHPVEVNLRCLDTRARVALEPRPEDLALALTQPRAQYWHPDLPFGPDWDMWRGGHRDLGVETVADFWSHRNLAALSVLWEGISREGDDRLREALRFVFTAIVNRASRRYQWNAKRPTNVLGGTLYIASLRYEFNVLSLWGRKLEAVAKYYASVEIPSDAVTVTQGSATSLRHVATSSIDYCFTDPPFGANIYYADASLLWEAWLGTLTDRAAEAVVSRKRPEKSVADYGALMTEALSEIKRCLKPDATATMVFQNTDDTVWTALKEAARDAGFVVLGTSTLHKSQPSFKGIKADLEGERVAATDVVLTLGQRAKQPVTARVDADALVVDALQEELARITTQRTASAPHMYAVAISALIGAGLPTAGWSIDRVARLLANLRPNPAEQLPLGISKT
jgi:16S rRNA G966 N2-methylase RsmD